MGLLLEDGEQYLELIGRQLRLIREFGGNIEKSLFQLRIGGIEVGGGIEESIRQLRISGTDLGGCIIFASAPRQHGPPAKSEDRGYKSYRKRGKERNHDIMPGSPALPLQFETDHQDSGDQCRRREQKAQVIETVAGLLIR